METAAPCVAVLAALSSLEPSYSIAGVVVAQLRLLTQKGHLVVFITTDDFADQSALPEGCRSEALPSIPWMPRTLSRKSIGVRDLRCFDRTNSA